MKRRERRYLLTITFVILSVCLLTETQAAELVWQSSKQAAVDLAKQQGKKVLLLAGRDS